MCGIVGVLGKHEVAPLLVESLKRLEYRGYDSAGIATVNNGALDRRRAVGKLVNLSDLLVHDPLAGKSGIGQIDLATRVRLMAEAERVKVALSDEVQAVFRVPFYDGIHSLEETITREELENLAAPLASPACEVIEMPRSCA